MNGEIDFTESLNQRLEILNINENIINKGIELIKTKISRIIVLVSMSGIRSKGKLAGYSMSKFALMSLCQTMRNEGWEHGLRVSAICPSWENTDMADGIKSEVSSERMTQPQDIADICSTILKLPNTSVPFEVKINCSFET